MRYLLDPVDLDQAISEFVGDHPYDFVHIPDSRRTLLDLRVDGDNDYSPLRIILDCDGTWTAVANLQPVPPDA